MLSDFALNSFHEIVLFFSRVRFVKVGSFSDDDTGKIYKICSKMKTFGK